MTSQGMGKIGPLSPRRTRRRGVATVEMAVVAPLLLISLFGIIEFGWVFMVQETVTNAAREACRVAVLQGADRNEVIDQFKAAMNATGLVDGQVTDGETIDDCPEGQSCDDWIVTIPSQEDLDDRSSANESVTITVSIPQGKASLAGLSSFVGFDRGVTTNCTMRKEGVVDDQEE